MAYIELPGVRAWYMDSGGSGTPMVLMHAASGTSECWEQQLPAFTAAGYRCVAYDRRGWGKSEPDPKTGEQPGIASDDLHALVDKLELDRFHLVGTAAGAAPAMDYTLSHPERVRSLTVADCTGGVREKAYLELHERMRPPEFQALPTVLREVSPNYRGLNPEGTKRWLEIEHASNHEDAPRQKARNDITFALLETLKVPVLAIAGQSDVSTPPALMRQFVEHIPNCRYETVPEAGHAAFWEQPEIWNRLVLEFAAQY
jgi:pimeloyl-ACP methyl ester carboxylesterase